MSVELRCNRLLRLATIGYAQLMTALLSVGCASSDPYTAKGTIAITNVNVIPMEREVVLRDQTIVIEGGKITAMGPAATVRAPEAAQRVAGRGRYLIPGLQDLHLHLNDPSELAVAASNGVTTVMNTWGTVMHLEWKEGVASGGLFGPRILTTSPVLDGSPPAWPGSEVVDGPGAADRLVRLFKEAGYDFLKVYVYLNGPTYEALTASARQHGMRWLGHVPVAIGTLGAAKAGQARFEHMDEILPALLSVESGFEAEVAGMRRGAARRLKLAKAWERVDEDRLATVADALKDSNVWLCPTLLVYAKEGDRARMAVHAADRRNQYASTVVRIYWTPESELPSKEAEEAAEASRRAMPHRLRIFKALHDRGVRMVLGTDAAVTHVVAGFGAIEELELYVAAGLSPFEALRTATIDASEFLGTSDQWGTIAVGKVADLVLLDDNPLDDISALNRRAGVFLRGNWYSRANLTERLEGLARGYAQLEP